MLQSGREVFGSDDMADIGRGVGSHHAQRGREDHEEGHDRHQAEYLRQDEVVGRIDTHDLQGVDLLRDAHRAQLRGDIGPHLARQDQAHDGGRKLQEHDLARGIARHPMGHPRALDIDLHLDADDGSDEEGDEQDDANGVDAELRHLLDILLEKHPHTLGTREGTPHQNEVFAEGGEPLMY